VALAGTGRAKEVNDFAARDEVQLGEGHDPAAIDGWLERQALEV